MEANSLIQTSTQAQPNINGTPRAITMEEITHTAQKLELQLQTQEELTQ